MPWAELPGYYDAANVFAMPCRTRRAGLDVEGLGIVYLEASATGLPVIGGDSGGAPDAILDGESGYVVSDVAGVAARDHRAAHAIPAKAKAMGEKGLAWVDREWREELPAARLAAILAHANPQRLSPPARPKPNRARLRPLSAGKIGISSDAARGLTARLDSERPEDGRTIEEDTMNPYMAQSLISDHIRESVSRRRRPGEPGRHAAAPPAARRRHPRGPARSPARTGGLR